MAEAISRASEPLFRIRDKLRSGLRSPKFSLVKRAKQLRLILESEAEVRGFRIELDTWYDIPTELAHMIQARIHLDKKYVNLKSMKPSKTEDRFDPNMLSENFVSIQSD